MPCAFANEISSTQITYKNPEKFRDFEMRLGEQDRKDKLKKELSHYIAKLWKKNIKNDSQLILEFTDIDMAGRIIFGIEQIREVRVDSDRSVLEFDYKIKNKEGKLIKSGHEKLINSNLSRANRVVFKFEHSRLKYEIAEMEKWIKAIAEELFNS